MTEIQNLGFLTDELIEPAVFLEEIIIVEAGDEKYIADLVPHQLLKRLDAAAVKIFYFQMIDLTHGLGLWCRKTVTVNRQRERRGPEEPVRIHALCILIPYTNPWSIIASATFRKPPMFAPLT
jgi:hypothetical protein